MRLNERAAIITEENMNRLEYLYGEINIDDLSRIVNDHLKVAIDEIEEDFLRKKAEAPDIIQMDMDAVFADKDGKTIEIKASEPEYFIDSIFKVESICSSKN